MILRRDEWSVVFIGKNAERRFLRLELIRNDAMFYGVITVSDFITIETTSCMSIMRPIASFFSSS